MASFERLSLSSCDLTSILCSSECWGQFTDLMYKAVMKLINYIYVTIPLISLAYNTGAPVASSLYDRVRLIKIIIIIDLSITISLHR